MPTRSPPRSAKPQQPPNPSGVLRSRDISCNSPHRPPPLRRQHGALSKIGQISPQAAEDVSTGTGLLAVETGLRPRMSRAFRAWLLAGSSRWPLPPDGCLSTHCARSSGRYFTRDPTFLYSGPSPINRHRRKHAKLKPINSETCVSSSNASMRVLLSESPSVATWPRI